MANTLYDKGRERYLTAQLNWSSDTVKLVLVTAGYTFSQSHEFHGDIGGSNIMSTSAAFTSKTTANGAAGAANVTCSSVTGSTITSIIIYKDSGASATSPLIAFIEAATGLPITPNGGDIIVTWDTGPNKIFKL